MCGSYRLCVFMPVMPKLFARQVFYMPFNTPATLSVFDNTAVQKYIPPSHPPLTTYIKLDIFSLPAVFSYFVGNYFSFDTSGLQCEFKVQPAKSIEI